MDYGNLASLAPLAVVGLTAVVAMLLAPFAGGRTVRGAAAFGLLIALILILERHGDPPAPATALLADDAPARLGALLSVLTGLAVLAFLPARAGAREGPALAVLATVGAATLAAAVHGASLFLGLEIASLALIALFAFPLDRAGLEAGYKYFVTGGAAAASLLLGIAFAFAATGSLALPAFAAEGALAAVGTALLFAALGFKFSLVPFHLWTPDVFQGAPAGAAAIAGVATKVAVAIVLLRLSAEAAGGAVLPAALALAGAASILLGNLIALRQTSLKRMLGHSSVAHTGYVAAILGSGAAIAPEAALFYLLAYAPALVAALCAAALLGRDPSLQDLKGLGFSRPLVGGVLALSLVSLAGLPPVAGFIGKVYLFTALAGAGAYGLLAVAAAGSALGFFYYFRFVATLFLPREEGETTAPAAGAAEAAVLAVSGGLLLLGGLWPQPFMALARGALP